MSWSGFFKKCLLNNQYRHFFQILEQVRPKIQQAIVFLGKTLVTEPLQNVNKTYRAFDGLSFKDFVLRIIFSWLDLVSTSDPVDEILDLGLKHTIQ